MWQRLHEQLRPIADGTRPGAVGGRRAARSPSATRPTWNARKATSRRWPSACSARQQMAQLGAAMQARRGIAPPSRWRATRWPHLRKDYGQASLIGKRRRRPTRSCSSACWFDEALKAEVNEPNAMSVATVDARGRPTSRIVLIKQFDAAASPGTPITTARRAASLTQIRMQRCCSSGANLSARSASKEEWSAPRRRKATSISTAGR